MSNHNRPQVTVATAVKTARIIVGMSHGQFGGMGVTTRTTSTAEISEPMMVPGLANR